MSQLKAVRLDTNVTPNQGATYSSSSIHRGGPQMRAAAAEARQALAAAARRRGSACRSAASRCRRASSRSTARPAPLGQLWRAARRQAVQCRNSPARRRRSRSTATSSSARACRASISRTRSAASTSYMQHVRVPGMLHGRVVRPRGQRAYGAGAKPLSVDESSIKRHPERARRAQGRLPRRRRRAGMGCRQAPRGSSR